MASRRAGRRGRWPLARTLSWQLGLLSLGLGLAGPVAAARTDFVAHMLGHLLVGMVAPLLLVLAAPVTLALRVLPVATARRLTRLLRSPVVRVLTHPVTAAVLDAGGLWLLYTTGLWQLTSSGPGHALVHVHVLLAGYLFTAAVVGVDPDPHRSPVAVRATVLVAFVAAHSVLAKWLYAHPPAGTGVREAEVGAQLMYYGGDVVHLALMVLLGLAWYRATGRLRTPDRLVRQRAAKA
nr:cytochrome c oxidase assembly protein [Auraticoccus cholistanensis]